MSGEAGRDKSSFAEVDEMMKRWRANDAFDRWSDQQLKIFAADLLKNLTGGDLQKVKPGDSLIRACPSVLGRLDYFPATVTKVDPEKKIIEVKFLVDGPRSGRYLISSGLSEHDDPNYGWLARYDESRLLRNGSPPLRLNGKK